MQVWQTFRNADDIEGRGPMIPDLTFLRREHAERYIDEQPGVMGRKAKWSQSQYGDWQMKSLEVVEHDVIEERLGKEKIRERALAKLSVEEREALGL